MGSDDAGNEESIVRMLSITKRFPGVTALDNVDLEVRAGEVHGLVGENGAGKTTLVNILMGMLQPDSGEIIFDGQKITGMNPRKARELGIAIVHQQVLDQPYLTVAENIFVGNWPTRTGGFVDWRRLKREAQAMLGEFGLDLDPNERMESLSVGSRQIVEISKALHADARVIILDEPTPPLTSAEIERLFKYIRLLRDKGVTFIYISHYLHEVFELCDRVTVLRDGRKEATRNADTLTEAELIRLMIGSDVDLFPKHRDWRTGEEALGIKRLATAFLQDINLSVSKGEIVGLFGLAGSGRTELARAIFGLDQRETGEIRVEGQPVAIRSPRDALNVGIGYLPENRREEGLVSIRSVKENITLPIIRSLTNMLGGIEDGQEKRIATEYVTTLNINTPSIDQEVQYLSGGNQQKVVLAKLLATKAKVLILDGPTQGIDVGAKAEIHGLMHLLAREGTAIILISSELPELLAMCHRIIVLRDGRIVANIPRKEASKSKLLLYAGGAATASNEGGSS